MDQVIGQVWHGVPHARKRVMKRGDVLCQVGHLRNVLKRWLRNPTDTMWERGQDVCDVRNDPTGVMQALRDVRREICDVRIILVDAPWDPGTVRQERKMAGNMVKARAG